VELPLYRTQLQQPQDSSPQELSPPPQDLDCLDSITAAMLYPAKLPLSLPLSAPLFRLTAGPEEHEFSMLPVQPDGLMATQSAPASVNGSKAASLPLSMKPLPAPCLVQPKLPPLPRKARTVVASHPPRPKAVASTTNVSVADTNRLRRDTRAPHRLNGVSTLSHQMLDLEMYTRQAGEAGGDAQPFAIRVHPIVLVAMDVHAHLCQHEVIGVLGGHFDSEAGCLTVVCARPVKEGTLDVGKIDVEMDPADQHRAVRDPLPPVAACFASTKCTLHRRCTPGEQSHETAGPKKQQAVHAD
jgi:hypothetical protein